MHVNPSLGSFLVYIKVSSGSGRNLQYWFRCPLILNLQKCTFHVSLIRNAQIWVQL